MVEIIPRPAEKQPIWQDAALYLSMIIFLVAFTSCFFLNFYLKKSSDQLDKSNNVLTAAKTEQENALERKAIEYRDKIEKFSKLINSHTFPSKIFPFIEKNSHPQVRFSKFQLTTGESKVTLSGETESFLTLEQQIKILESNPQIKNIDLSNVSIGEKGKIGFNLSFSFDKNILLSANKNN